MRSESPFQCEQQQVKNGSLKSAVITAKWTNLYKCFKAFFSPTCHRKERNRCLYYKTFFLLCVRCLGLISQSVCLQQLVYRLAYLYVRQGVHPYSRHCKVGSGTTCQYLVGLKIYSGKHTSLFVLNIDTKWLYIMFIIISKIVISIVIVQGRAQ